jgi:hypothetical protein
MWSDWECGRREYAEVWVCVESEGVGRLDKGIVVRIINP